MYATEAKEYADRFQWIENKMDYTLDLIKKCASKGKYGVKVHNLNSWSINTLEKLGYKIYDNAVNTNTILITWGIYTEKEGDIIYEL